MSKPFTDPDREIHDLASEIHRQILDGLKTAQRIKAKSSQLANARCKEITGFGHEHLLEHPSEVLSREIKGDIGKSKGT
jgi:hypothetical protein